MAGAITASPVEAAGPAEADSPAGEAKAADPSAAWLQDVRAEWLELFDLPLLGRIGASLKGAELTPPAHLIFEAFRFGRPADTRAVIIGQDPYPTPGSAQGLAFSTPRGAPLSVSLRNIFGCLAAGGQRPAPRAECGDLGPWAAQGVLLLNCALTARPGESGSHLSVWRPFVAALVRALCAGHPGGLHFFLWGDVARGFAALAAERHTVHVWTHPSPAVDNRLAPEARFRNCPHFAALPQVRWNNLAPAFAFCDGACSGNGTAAAAAGFAAVLVGGPFRPGAAVWGRVEPLEYRFRPGERPALAPGGAAARPSNNRAELLAIAHGVQALLRARACGRVEIVSDSLNSVRTLTEWLPARAARGTAAELKNKDLLDAVAALLERLKQRAASVRLTHVRGHQPRSQAAGAPEPARAAFLRKGNAAADRLAVRARQLAGPGVLERGAETWRTAI